MFFIIFLIAILLFVFLILIVTSASDSNSNSTVNDGERFVARKLNSLDNNFYKVLNDVLIPANNKIKTSQIDHIVISNFGVFCIETKAYTGWIFGDANDQYWTQVIYNKKFRFYNPIKQNFGHVKAIEDLLASSHTGLKVFSFIAFPDADKIKVTSTNLVGHASDIVDKIKILNQAVLSDLEKEDIYNIILNYNITDETIRRRHIDGVKEIKDKTGIDLYNEQNNINHKKRYKQKRKTEEGYDDNYDSDYDDYDDDDYDDDYDDCDD